MKNQLRGCVRINASGKNLYKFINMIHCGRISCFGQYCRRDVFYGEIYRHDLAKVEEMAEECGVELKSAEYNTISSKVLRYKKRIGIILGILLVLTAALYFSNIVVTIEIQGNSAVSDDAILAALSELDIKQGTPLRKINFHYCENELRVMVDGISWAAIRHTGNRVVVEVTEIIEKPEMVQERMPCNVVAKRGAQITYTSVYDGMLMHKVGDYVPEGTLLVSGVTEDDTGHVTLHHAMGTIKGIYEETVTFTGEYNFSRYIPTGDTSNERYLRLFNLKIPLFFGKNDYKSSDSEVTESRLKLFGKELPIGIIKEYVSETELSETVYTDDELKEQLMEKIYLYEKNFLGDDIEIIDREIKTEKNKDSLTYTVKYKLEGDICEQREIFVKE